VASTLFATPLASLAKGFLVCTATETRIVKLDWIVFPATDWADLPLSGFLQSRATAAWAVDLAGHYLPPPNGQRVSGE
jgi:hypothetical protein